MVSREQVIEVLKQCFDPELHIDVWTLGLIYDIKIEEQKVDVTMTFTSPMCPFGPWLVEDITRKVKEIQDVKDVHVEVVFEPAWKPSDEIKLTLGIQ